ncbi:hypothetical protein QZH41_005268 [Actinostola sp. cb2023]|nr:hypothetical protein QZH41_005268 [Actinostola sp. cb2023]
MYQSLKEDKRAVDILQRTTKMCEGHYETGLLWRKDDLQLPKNKPEAERRMRSLKRKFAREPDLETKYRAVMDGYIAKGHARKLSPEEAAKTGPRTWYLPHFSVTNPNKPGKLRIVFDAAAECEGTSLNKNLLHGPDCTNSLVGVLMRFRQENNTVVADIESMFHQVKVQPDDHDSLRFLWWSESVDEPPEDFVMTVHIFGAADSPCSANSTLKRLADDNQKDFDPITIETLRRNFYVDDILKSVPTPSEAIRLAEQLEELCARGGFNLTKFMSNNRQVLAAIPIEKRAAPTLDLDLDELPTDRALGIQWDVESDTFGFKVTNLNKPDTMRGVLSTISSVFDPLNLAAPAMLPAKQIMQTLWRRKLPWDQPLDGEILEKWKKWKSSLPLLQNFRITRCYFSRLDHEGVRLQLHHFCDASEAAYGTATYLRIEYPDGVIECSFIAGKSRNAPIKSVSIPRLELQGALLAARVDHAIRKELDFKFEKNETRRFQTYVANRITEIRELTSPDQWRHCPGKLNPADDWVDTLRKIAWLLKFIDWLKSRSVKKKELIENDIQKRIGPDDLERSKRHVAILVQRTVYPEEMRNLKEGKRLKASSEILKLKPIMKEDDVMRVGGRMSLAPISPDAANPIILPKKHHITTLLIRHLHESNGHCGVEQLLKQLAPRMHQGMGELPKVRMIPYEPPFTYSGVDYFGPFYVKRGRGRVIEKRWGAIFTCMNSRAVHLEVAKSLETDDFILVLMRFLNRRGQVKELRSDNGAAHMSGVWERLVRIVKRSLKAILGNDPMNEEVLNTVFTEAERIANSRPLTRNPSGIVDEKDKFSRKRWRQAQLLANHYWKHDNVPRNQWVLGRVINVFPGADGLAVRISWSSRMRGTMCKNLENSLLDPQKKSLLDPQKKSLLDPQKTNLCMSLYDACSKGTREEVKEANDNLIKAIESQHITEKMNELDVDQEKHPMFKVARKYMRMVMDMLQFIRAVRTGDWELHLKTLQAFTKYLFAHDRLNYARMMPLYLAEIQSLETTYPEIYVELIQGNWVVNKNARVPFCALGADHGLEHINRSMKVTGGLVGITLNPSARSKFFLIAPELAKLAEQAKVMAGVSSKIQTHHHNLTTAVLNREDKKVEKLLATIKRFTNPFLEESK